MIKNVTAENSICPAEWRLSRGQSNAISTPTSREFSQLFYVSNVATSLISTEYTTNGAVTVRKEPLFLTRSGYVWAGDVDNTARIGYYWASTVYSSTHAYNAYFLDSFIRTANGDRRFSGRSVRCVLD